MDARTVSIIIPVFNTEKYLSNCLDSVCKQKYADLQILLVDDGSTDSSFQICKTYAEKDSRITLISQKNAGVSAARNKALDQANGYYLCFVDSDDCLEDDAIETLVHAHTNEDLVISGYSTIDEDGSCTFESVPPKDLSIDNITMSEYMIVPPKSLSYQGYLWNKMFINSTIQANNVRFDEQISYNEDRLFIIQYLSFSHKVRFISNKTYLYRQRRGSAMDDTSKCFQINQLSELDAFDRIITILEGQKAYYMAQKASARSAKIILSRVPRGKENQSLRAKLKSYVFARSKNVIFCSSRKVSFVDRCKCICYCLQTVWR